MTRTLATVVRCFVGAAAIAACVCVRGTSPDPLVEEASRHQAIGVAAMQRADYRLARAELQISRALYASARDRRDAAHVDLNLAYEAELRADWSEVRTRATAARDAFASLGDRIGEARALRQMSRDRTLSPRAAEQVLDETVRLARSTHDPNVLAEALIQRADERFSTADYAAAMADYEPAIAEFDRAGDRQQLARALVSLGRVYRAHGEPERALPLYRRALSIQQPLGDMQGAIQSINAIAVTDDLLGRRPEALREYERALALAQQTGAPRLIGFQLGNLGGAYLKRADFARAVDLLHSALRQPNDPLVASIRQSQLAEAYRKMGRPHDALPYSDAAVAYDRSAHREDALIEDLTDRARTRAALGQTSAALEDVREALDALETVRRHLVPADSMKQGFTRLYQDAYAVAIDLLARRDAAAALDVSEEARSRALLDLLASRNLQVPAKPASAAEVQATARRLGSTLLLYFVTDDATFAWIVDAKRIVLRRLDVQASRLAELVAHTRPARPEAVLWTAGANDSAWRELDRILIEPLRRDLPDRNGALLTVVPHGALFGLSFAGLQDASGRYLIERYTLDYAPSVAVLRFTRATAASAPARQRYLLIADPSSPATAGAPSLPPLPGTRDELRAVADVVPSDRRSVLGGAATRPGDVLKDMHDATVIHFATHAVVDDADPLGSFLALDGGKLTVADIYQLRLDADLVILSACRTALGRISGDGVAGMTRAFVYAGAASVMATTWDVADAPTVRIVQQFYRERLSGGSKAASLRDAQLRLLEDLRGGRVVVPEPDGPVALRPDPYFWAGFVLVGEP